MKIGYKGFSADECGNLYCEANGNKKYYKVGDVAEQGGALSMCENGIHFCWNINDVHQYYNLKEKVVCIVEILGDVLNDTDMKKSCTNKLKVIEILTKERVFALSNTGKDNTGIACSGNRNSGDMNSGNWNNGNCNSGNWNSGNRNSGNRNSGNWNSGKRIRPYKCAVYMPFRTALEWLAQSFMGEKDRITYINGEWEIEP